MPIPFEKVRSLTCRFRDQNTKLDDSGKSCYHGYTADFDVLDQEERPQTCNVEEERKEEIEVDDNRRSNASCVLVRGKNGQNARGDKIKGSCWY